MSEGVCPNQVDEKLQPMVAEISWTKNLVIIEKCKEELERECYIRMTKRYGWTKDVLSNSIKKMTIFIQLFRACPKCFTL